MNKKNIKISIVSPVYQAELIVDQLVSKIEEEILKITDNYEIILVDDGSSDNSWSKILDNCNKKSKLKGIKLTRNFGQHYAISSGLSKSTGDYVIVIDCDLQENPIYFANLLKEVKKGYEIVLTQPLKRKHKWYRNFLSFLFHKFFKILMNNKSLQYDTQYGTLSIISRRVVTEFLKFNDYHRHYLFIINWLGFKKKIIYIEHEPRYIGHSSYNLKKLIIHAIDGIISNTDKLLKLSIYTGFVFAIIGLFSILYIIH